MNDTGYPSESGYDFQALADREAEIVDAEQEPFVPDFGVAPLPVSDAALALIVRHETGGRPFYEKVIKARPIWPAGASGVTIGFGYDIGYVSAADLRRDWAELGSNSLDRLARACGRHGDPALAALAASMSDIRVSWDMSERVFKARTLPKFVLLTMSSLANTDELSPDSFGALVSLTFNRGASFAIRWNPAKDPKDRYREMRAIKDAMAAKQFTGIPDLIRSMTRLWRGTAIEAEMTRRRKNEAALFAYGLTTQSAPFVPSFDLSDDDGSGAGIPGTSDDQEAPDGAEFEGQADAFDFAPAISAAAVRWAEDERSPDYAHLVEAPPTGGLFRLNAAALEALSEANDFALPDGARILFGLRGCAIVDGGGGFSESVTLRDIRPDHQVARCVLGVWDRAKSQIAVFAGSTVPNAAAVVSWRAKHDRGNLLSTGLYGYIVGTHNGKPGCFLLRKTASVFREVVVRRSSADLEYSLDDMAHVCTPGDNIHPTFFQTTAAFSSVGCQVVVGSASPAGDHRGPWAKFREMAGQVGPAGTPGAPYFYMLLTGAEAALARSAPPRRLRFGSSGERVRAMQEKLGISAPDGEFGPATSAALHALQKKRAQGRSDGIYTPSLDVALDWSILGA
ncbi:hypothetical protein GOFOIKOB_5483 [Methylobacterium tardum]|uniref:Peptidoglycan binding-like domain-containing protein n=1 Tax=Methylobacterium tardum TaxID=374432 RepID=A0AA37WSA0_9HYPH|nr:peptidoglycan-binding protein [Methylobacterium tardum]GJE52412.1 hypothetical protein GOFOIKOB_5483 [Methylobacterium tardum]GLS69028.1 hypothetical protein GCM10007890_10400 [Methylobacterium tardum]